MLVAALLAMVLVNGWLLRRRFAPLEQLIDAMERVDLGAPRAARRDARRRASRRSRACTAAFDRMLERLEDERDRTASAVLQAQESERARLARDLHDEANQALTGVLLRLEATAQDAPPGPARRAARDPGASPRRRWRSCCAWPASCAPSRSTTSASAPPCARQVDDFGRRAGLATSLRLPAAGLEDLDADEQIVVYRVVQEGLSNVARHAGARTVRVERRAPSGADASCASPTTATASTPGAPRPRRPRRSTGMRERARPRRRPRATSSPRPARARRVELRHRRCRMRILIADDHGVVRGGLRLLLDRQADMEVVGEAADGAEAVERDAAPRAPTCAILDVAMPRLTGLQATREISAHAPDVDVLDPLDARRRALPVRGAEGRRVGLRAQARGRPRPRRRGPRGQPRRARS